MRRLLLAQTRANLARMIASGLAIVIGAAFVVITFGVVATSDRAVLDTVAAQYASSAAVVADPSPSTDAATTSPLVGVQAALVASGTVGSVVLDYGGSLDLTRPGSTTTQTLPFQTLSPAGPLRWEQVLRGRLPAAAGEIAVSGPSGLSVGDVVSATPVRYGDYLAEPHAPTPAPAALRVVGVVDLGGDPRGGVGAQLFVDPTQVTALGGLARQLRATAVPGESQTQAFDAVRQTLAAEPATADLTLRTGNQVARLVAESYTGSTAGITAALLVFVVIALLVAGLVIANTFAVVLAQRVEELALLRCVGASTPQIRRMVLGEALVLGLLASAAGTVLGVGLTTLTAQTLGNLTTAVPLGDVVIPGRALAAAMALGTVTTVLAAIVPARAATRVSPLAALRPLAPVTAPTPGRRVAFGVTATAGAASLFGLLLTARDGQLVPAAALGVVSFLAAVLVAQHLAPAAVAATGRVLAHLGGVPAAVAARNTTRNPRRVAACVTALLIGITLTSAVVVGSASAKTTAADQLVTSRPIDVTVTGAEPLPPALSSELAQVSGVKAVATVATAPVRIGTLSADALAVDPERAGAVIRSGTTLPVPTDGQIVMDYTLADRIGATDGSTVTVVGSRGQRKLTVVLGNGPGAYQRLLLTSADLTALADAAVGTEWVRLADGLDPDATDNAVTAVTRVAVAAAPTVTVTADVAERQGLNQILDALVLVVSGLLAISIVIALLGVGNTLALAALERRRESGLLRALGFTRRQLAGTLIWEALSLSLTTAVAGCLAGIFYGIVGANAALGRVVVSVPWVGLGLIAATGTLAGVIAALLPARRMARGPVASALAVIR